MLYVSEKYTLFYIVSHTVPHKSWRSAVNWSLNQPASRCYIKCAQKGSGSVAAGLLYVTTLHFRAANWHISLWDACTLTVTWAIAGFLRGLTWNVIALMHNCLNGWMVTGVLRAWCRGGNARLLVTPQSSLCGYGAPHVWRGCWGNLYQHSTCVLLSSCCAEQLYKKPSCWSQSHEITWCDLKELKPTAHSSHSPIPWLILVH